MKTKSYRKKTRKYKRKYRKFLNLFFANSKSRWVRYKKFFSEEVIEWSLNKILVKSMIDMFYNPLILNINAFHILYFGSYISYERQTNMFYDLKLSNMLATSHYLKITNIYSKFNHNVILDTNRIYNVWAFTKYVSSDFNFYEIIVDYSFKLDLHSIYWGPLENVYTNLYYNKIYLFLFSFEFYNYIVFVLFIKSLIGDFFLSIKGKIKRIRRKRIKLTFKPDSNKLLAFQPNYGNKNLFYIFYFFCFVMFESFVYYVLYVIMLFLYSIRWIMLLFWKYIYLYLFIFNIFYFMLLLYFGQTLVIT